MEDKIVDIVAEVCENDIVKTNRDIDLIENEMIDSLAFIELIARLEEEFDIEIQPTQVESNVWASVSLITKMVEKLME